LTKKVKNIGRCAVGPQSNRALETLRAVARTSEMPATSVPVRLWPCLCWSALLLASAAGCAAQRPADTKPKVSLGIIDYKEGDRSAMLQVKNQGKRSLVYEGPYVEQKTTNGWVEYKSDEPEMADLSRPRRIGPSLNDAWWVRIPPGRSRWRAFVRCHWLPAGKSSESSPEFSVWSPERRAPDLLDPAK
jgi:hypothetical protein